MLVAIIIIAVIILAIWAISGINKNRNEYINNNIQEDFKPLNINNQPKGIKNSVSNYPRKDIDNSYAFANRLKNIIFSRRINELDLINYVNISLEELNKYKYSKGLPPNNVLKSMESYFNVSFRFLADYKETKLTVYDNGIRKYEKTYTYPHKARFSTDGHCILLDKINKSEVLYHLDPQGNTIGSISEFPNGNMEFVKISDDGLHSIIVSEKQKIFFLDLQKHTILWDKFLRLNTYNIKDITDNELIFRFTKSDKPIDFSLDFSGNPYNITELSAYFSDNLPPIRYHTDGYIFLISAMLNCPKDHFDNIIKMIKYMTKPTSVKYLPLNKLSQFCKSIGILYIDNSEYEVAEQYLKKALLYNPKIAVKKYINKIETMKLKQ